MCCDYWCLEIHLSFIEVRLTIFRFHVCDPSFPDIDTNILKFQTIVYAPVKVACIQFISYDLCSSFFVHWRVGIYCLLFFWLDFFPFHNYCLQGTNIVAVTYISFASFSCIKSLIMTCKLTDVMLLCSNHIRCIQMDSYLRMHHFQQSNSRCHAQP